MNSSFALANKTKCDIIDNEKHLLLTGMWTCGEMKIYCTILWQKELLQQNWILHFKCLVMMNIFLLITLMIQYYRLKWHFDKWMGQENHENYIDNKYSFIIWPLLNYRQCYLLVTWLIMRKSIYRFVQCKNYYQYFFHRYVYWSTKKRINLQEVTLPFISYKLYILLKFSA